MQYKRSDKPLPLKRRLSREELKVYTVCRNAVTIGEMVEKTGLDQIEIIIVLNSFIPEGLIRVLEHS